MFVEHKEALEITEAPAKTLKLSEAIRKGLNIVEESPSSWMFCALGAAFAGVHGRQMTDCEVTCFVLNKKYKRTAHAIADAIGYSQDLCDKVHRQHCLLEPAAKIADRLEVQGY
jgi:hypothetical protein